VAAASHNVISVNAADPSSTAGGHRVEFEMSDPD
jgi:hypothetical protein